MTASPPSDTTPPPRYERRIMTALRRLMQSIDLQSRSLQKQHDITVPQITVLYELHEKGTMTLAVLARTIHLSASTVVGIVDRLEEKGYVARSRTGGDRRAVFINLTDKGMQFVTRMPHLLHEQLHASLARVSESEQMLIANALDLLVHLGDEKEPS